MIKDQLVSLEQQSFDLSNILLLIRDDGSTDQSYDVLQKFAQSSSLHVKIFEDKTNLGIIKSFEFLMIKALEKNEVKYIMFCDQDDVWKSDKIEKTYLKMKEQEQIVGQSMPILVHSNLMVVDKNLTVIAPSFWKYQNINPSKDSFNRLLLHNTVTGCTMMMNRALAEKVKNIHKEAIMHDWWIALVASVFGKISYIDEPLTLYRQHGGNDTGAKKYGVYYVCHRLFMKCCTNKYTSRYIMQANAFLEIYANDLDDKNKSMLQAFQHFPFLTKLQKIGFLFKYHVWKNGFIRNLGLIFFA